MQFNEKYLSLPPYLSTTWNYVTSLRMVGSALQISLTDKSFVTIRDLEMDVVEGLFAAHAAYLNRQSNKSISEQNKESEIPPQNPIMGNSIIGEKMGAALPFHFGLGGKEVFGGALQHNIEFANAPDLPEEIITKIASIVKIVAPSDSLELPQPEPHCNCPHCQIARAINLGLGHEVKPFSGRSNTEQETSVEIEDVPADDELKFQQWHIEQVGENLYNVTNKLDIIEHYQVFLGSPVGCTCGKQGCEHVIAVLES